MRDQKQVRVFQRLLLLACAAVGWTAAGAGPAALEHWAFQPVKMPAAPALAATSRVQTPVDAFVIAGLSARGLELAPQADRATLIRRAYFNLVGIPPAAEEVERFVADPLPNAFPDLVERLLSDVRFGERWGRYWLDVARYADSKGYVFQEERRYPYSYTYRDWVIRAFNSDLPYDKFVLAQLAADQSMGKEDPQHLAAMGFLTLGRRFLNNEPDIIDDRIDVTFRGLQGLTVACARCHDHKFDPIPTADYYSLYGVFASGEEPSDKPLLSTPQRNAEFLAFEAELNKRQKKANDYFAEKKRALFTAPALQKYLQLCVDGWSRSEREFATLAKERQVYASVGLRWRDHLRNLGQNDGTAGPWLALLQTSPALLAYEPGRALAPVLQTISANPRIAEALAAANPASMADVNRVYAETLAKHHSAEPMADPDAESIRGMLMAQAGIAGIEERRLMRDFSVAEKEQAGKLRNEVESFKVTSENSPPRGMVIIDKAQPTEPHVFVRGNARSPGAKVPRQFLSCIGPARQPFQHGSGRLELAQTIASNQNPLTARVFANRVWGWLTGQPLVDTPSDFGIRTPPPANPELLEYLAASFVKHGWSTKHLVREIVLSAAWQQSAQAPAPNPPAEVRSQQSLDSANKLFGKANRRRRDFESFRDSMLAVSGRIDGRVGGRPVDINDASNSRRTVYGFIDRQNLPSLFRAFDFASPDQHSPMRFETTVPQQALFALNNPFVVEQARALAQPSPSSGTAPSSEERVQELYRAVLSRHADGAELKTSLAFVQSAHGGQSAGPWEFGWGKFDGTTVNFHPLPHFSKERWAGGINSPDPQLGFVQLMRDGGHPGDPDHAAILRWHSAGKTRVHIEGELKRPSEAGDGIRLRIVSNLRSLLGEWDVAAASSAKVKIEAVHLEEGETLNFVVDCKENEASDSFQFAPRIVDAMNGKVLASAAEEFAGPALDPWIALAQVLLVSNEFMFVD